MTAADKDGRNALTGVWHGQYDYPAAFEPVHFVATLIDVGGQLSGTTHETASHRGQTSTRMATISGSCAGTHVRFLKIYSPASEEFQDVIYDGALNGDKTEISGEWMIPGEWTGRFMMIRSRSEARARSRQKTVDA